MSKPEKEKERCKWCGEQFERLASHTPHCPVYKLQQEADEHIQDLEIKPKGGIKEIDVPASSTATITPDRFWSWTEGLGIQMGVVIGHLNDTRQAGGNIMKLLREQLYAINSGMADQIELLKEIVAYEKLRVEMMAKVETKIEEIIEDEPKVTFKKVPTPSELSKEYDEMRVEETEVKTYKEEITLPEGTRQLTGAVTITTDKAFEILFTNGKQVWIPKSTVHSTTKEGGENQTFVIDSWVLKKNGVIGEDD